MRVSYEWLKEYVRIDLTAAELADRLTMAGIAVEMVEDQADRYQQIVVGKVAALAKHPAAAKLTIARIEVGSGAPKQVITAATNLKVGDLAPLALSGAVLPDGHTISAGKFKGVVSDGMLCSGAELELEKESTGIWEFDRDWAPGTPVAEALGATDQILVLELTANRADCLGMIGVAREVAAILDAPLTVKPISLRESGPPVESLAQVEIVATDLCTRYAGRVVRGIKIGPSPQWLQRRLKAAGVRPISNIVDITNYVMLEYNQPLHAFDLDRLAGGRVIVRRARPGEKITTLDGVERVLTGESLLIADPTGGQCVAGVMGGNNSEVTDRTVNLFLESAYFDPGSIRKTNKALEMHTEAGLRFERGIDPNGAVMALNRAAELIELLNAGQVARGYIDQYPQPVTPVAIAATCDKINRWLGTELDPALIQKYLERVNFTVAAAENGAIKVTVPTYRRDVSHMADLAEEVARLHGYDRIPLTLPPSRTVGKRTALQQFQFDLRRLLQGVGLSEIITSSLNAKDMAAKLGIDDESHPFVKTVDLMAPLSEEQAVMRTTLANGMLEALAFNAKRHQTDLAFYELARVYLPREGEALPAEPLHLALGLTGRRQETGWNQPAVAYDFYDLKGIWELIVGKFALPEPEWRRSRQPFLHPGQAADLRINGQCVGYLGRLHPRIQEAYGLTQAVYLLEVDLTLLASGRCPEIAFVAPGKYPAIQRDLALVLPAEIAAAEVMAQIKECGGHLVETVELFDVYQGDQVPAGHRSLAFSLSYRSAERTLNDNEINQMQTELLQKLNAKYGAVVRG
jgi:phenylalanyl-tRNA synthetase beta chain